MFQSTMRYACSRTFVKSSELLWPGISDPSVKIACRSHPPWARRILESQWPDWLHCVIINVVKLCIHRWDRLASMHVFPRLASYLKAAFCDSSSSAIVPCGYKRSFGDRLTCSSWEFLRRLVVDYDIYMNFCHVEPLFFTSQTFPRL